MHSPDYRNARGGMDALKLSAAKGKALCGRSMVFPLLDIEGLNQVGTR